MSVADDGGPSDRARELVRGAFDLHVHVSPDVIARRIDDVSLAHRFRDLGLAGFALKSHYVPTSERAAVVRAAVPEVTAIGAIALNAAVGGLNALAVEIAAREVYANCPKYIHPRAVRLPSGTGSARTARTDRLTAGLIWVP